ncbi:MAG: SRPBCC family protein [Caulobacteraceae bacterium]
MASIRQEIIIAAAPDTVWDAICDVGNLETRVARGFVVKTEMEEGVRMVTFANGMQAREWIMGFDHHRRRFAYSVESPRLTRHAASFQVFAEGEDSRVVWLADVLPHEAGDTVGQMMAAGIRAMKATLEA